MTIQKTPENGNPKVTFYTNNLFFCALAKEARKLYLQAQDGTAEQSSPLTLLQLDPKLVFPACQNAAREWYRDPELNIQVLSKISILHSSNFKFVVIQTDRDAYVSYTYLKQEGEAYAIANLPYGYIPSEQGGLYRLQDPQISTIRTTDLLWPWFVFFPAELKPVADVLRIKNGFTGKDARVLPHGKITTGLVTEANKLTPEQWQTMILARIQLDL